jgi:GH35 family endo-1,4-beta-xylanase
MTEEMSAERILDTADSRIRDCRTAEARLKLLSRSRKPLAGFSGRVRLVRHEFKLGANAFRIGTIKDPGLQRAYDDRFAAVLNYATLPFYWGAYEGEKDRPSAERLRRMAEWCRARGIAPKGHPLVWHEVFPRWAESLDDSEVMRRQEARVRAIVSEFAGLVGIWDVVNEATVSQRFDNAVGRWIKRDGAAACVARALGWAHEADSKALLLYNDFNVSPEFESLVESLVSSRAPLGAIGVQSHMHKGVRPLEWVWRACEDYGRFGRPVHFTEATILSGTLKAANDNDWHRVRTDWLTTSEGEASQLEHGRRFYTVLFSHPKVEAVTWWDFSDDGAWQGAPAGLVRRDMSPKPLYEWLAGAFGPGGRWSTDAAVQADSSGSAAVRCFFGEHEVTGSLPSGEKLRGRFALGARGTRSLEVLLE